MMKQRGGSMKISGYLALALLALAAGEATVIRHLYAHRAIQITMPTSRHSVGIFPRYAYTCGSAGAICYLTI